MSELYSEISRYYNEIFPINHDLVQWVTGVLQPGDRLLDIGCSNGWVTGMLSKKGLSVIGTDINKAMIDEAAALWPEGDFRVMDMRDINGIDGEFDCIVCIGNVMSYLPGEQKNQLINDVYSKLKRGGYWVSQFVNWDDILTRKTYEFPDKELPDHGVVFKRRYRQIRRESVIFRKELVGSERTVSEEETMFPITADEYNAMHRDVGFSLFGHWRDFKGTPHDPARPGANVFIWRR